MMTDFDYKTGREPFEKSSELVSDSPSLTPGIDAATSRYNQRLQQEHDPVIDQILLDNPGAPGRDVVDWHQMAADGKIPQPSEDGKGVAFIDDKYFKGGKAPRWGYDFTSKTKQATGSFDRYAARTSRNVMQGVFETFVHDPYAVIRAGAETGVELGVGHVMDLYSTLTQGKTYSRDLDEIWDEKAREMFDRFDATPELPEMRTAHPDTIQGMAEVIGSDISTILIDIGIGTKMMGATRLNPVKAEKMIHWILDTGKQIAMRERGVALGEILYSKAGMPGNLSTMLTEFGFEGDLIEYLDSTNFDSETEMAMKNVLEGVLIAETLRIIAGSARLGKKIAPEVYEYLKNYQPKPVGAPGTQKGMVGWHGSPHKMPPESLVLRDGEKVWVPDAELQKTDKVLDTAPLGRFRGEKIGTGEGAQAYGYGHYIAERKGVGMSYAPSGSDQMRQDVISFAQTVPRKLRGDDAAKWLKQNMSGAGNEISDAEISLVVQNLDDPDFVRGLDELNKFTGDQEYTEPWNAAYNDLFDRVKGGHLYEVDIDDTLIDNMLEWDAPLSEQPESVLNALRKGGIVEGDDVLTIEGAKSLDDVTGNDLYDLLTTAYGEGHIEGTASNRMQGVSEHLNSIGIPGIKYFDGTSRATAKAQRQQQGIVKPLVNALKGDNKIEGTRNFVVFDEANLKVIGRDGEKLPATPESKAVFPEYAEQYPELPVPIVKPKDDGGTYRAKGKSTEDTAFRKERARIQKDMDANGFDPYFDPEARFDVDPKNYPQRVDTQKEGYPAKQETTDQWRKKIHTDEARDRLQAAYDNGVKTGGHDRWYFMGQLEKSFVDELGEEAGRKAFREMFSDAMSATTAGRMPEENLLMALYSNYLRKNGLPLPEGSFDTPTPVSGGRYGSRSALEQHQKFLKDGVTINQPKQHNFSSNFEGWLNSATIDEHMKELIDGSKGAPQWYGIYEELVIEMAKKNGISPRAFQDIAWGGKKAMDEAKRGRSYFGKPMIQIVNEAIERTSRLTGMSPDEVVKRGIIRGEIPIYAHPAGTLAAGSMAIAAMKGRQEDIQ